MGQGERKGDGDEGKYMHEMGDVVGEGMVEDEGHVKRKGKGHQVGEGEGG